MHTPRPGGQGHMHARLLYKHLPSMHRLRAAAISALNCLFVHHLAAWPENLGVIAWLLHCCSLAACAKDMVFQGLAWLLPWMPKPGALPSCQTSGLSVSQTCLHICAYTFVMCAHLALLFSFSKAHVQSVTVLCTHFNVKAKSSHRSYLVFFAVVIMSSVLEHWLFKDLPDCHHEHTILACSRLRIHGR